MITKFESYNESRLFKRKLDGDIKELIKHIKDNFDINKLLTITDGYRYDDIKITEEGYEDTDYVLRLGNDNISNDVSDYIMKDLYKFFDKIITDKDNIEKMNRIKSMKNNLLGNSEELPLQTKNKKISGIKRFLD